MKLKIKETGEVLEDVKFIDTTLHKITIQYLDNGVLRECSVKNLSDVEEVKDYEEPKKYWYITGEGNICRDDIKYSEWIEERKQIGNYFDTKEEDEKAVERLKALNKLCRKGFEFNGVEMFGSGLIRIEASIPINEKTTLQERSDITDSLYLLFGGEE